MALASLDVRPVNANPLMIKLDMLYVDVEHCRRGIGHQLVELLAARARPVIADPPEPDLLAREPDDIHLLLAL